MAHSWRKTGLKYLLLVIVGCLVQKTMTHKSAPSSFSHGAMMAHRHRLLPNGNLAAMSKKGLC
jgi:hypothetical protein